MENVQWIKCSDGVPNGEDIIKNNGDSFWGYFVNQYGETYVDLVGWNSASKTFETGTSEIVLAWAYLNRPKAPHDLIGII